VYDILHNAHGPTVVSQHWKYPDEVSCIRILVAPLSPFWSLLSRHTNPSKLISSIAASIDPIRRQSIDDGERVPLTNQQPPCLTPRRLCSRIHRGSAHLKAQDAPCRDPYNTRKMNIMINLGKSGKGWRRSGLVCALHRHGPAYENERELTCESALECRLPCFPAKSRDSQVL
jgi:hypothetical protein